jgi:hypothetical protein
MNVQDPSFQGRIVDLSSARVVNARTGQLVTNWFPHLVQPNILVLPGQEIPPGAVQTYDVYFAYRPTDTGSIGTFLNSEAGAAAFVILVILTLVFGVLAAKEQLPRLASRVRRR